MKIQKACRVAIKEEPSMDLQKKMAGDAYRVMFTFILI